MMMMGFIRFGLAAGGVCAWTDCYGRGARRIFGAPLSLSSIGLAIEIVSVGQGKWGGCIALAHPIVGDDN
jgi:hypothetical protein